MPEAFSPWQGLQFASKATCPAWAVWENSGTLIELKPVLPNHDVLFEITIAIPRPKNATTKIFGMSSFIIVISDNNVNWLSDCHQIVNAIDEWFLLKCNGNLHELVALAIDLNFTGQGKAILLNNPNFQIG